MGLLTSAKGSAFHTNSLEHVGKYFPARIEETGLYQNAMLMDKDGSVIYTIQTTVAAGSAAEYIPINPSDVTVTNTDNDAAGVTVNPINVTTGEPNVNGTFTVILTSQPLTNVTVNLVSSDTTEGTVPASIVFTSADWNVVQTVTITAVDDAIDDGSQIYTIQTTVAAGSSVTLWSGYHRWPGSISVSPGCTQR